MLNQRVVFLCAAAAAVAGGGVAQGQTFLIAPSSAISFQNEGTLTFNDTVRLSTQDGIYGPTVTGTVTHNAYATGSSTEWFDGVSLSFDLAAAGVNFANINSASLEFYVRNGTSGGWANHTYQVLAGAFNPTNQDSNPAGVSFDLPNGGLLTSPIASAQFTSNTFNVTLRLWEVNVDMIRLAVTIVPTPGAAAALGLGGLMAMRRRR